MGVRSKKELGQLMLDYRSYFKSGLCRWVSKLRYEELITEEEQSVLILTISNNRPTKNWLERNIWNPDKKNNSDHVYYWQKDFIKPRIKWIKKHLINSK